MVLSTLNAVQDEAARALAARDEVRATDGNGLTRDLAIEFRDDNGAVMRVKFTFQIEHSKARFRLAASFIRMSPVGRFFVAKVGCC
jgi:hypothetical protein